MCRQWILIGQSILKTIRTIGDKKCPSRGGRNRTRTCAKSRPVTAGTVINGLKYASAFRKYGFSSSVTMKYWRKQDFQNLGVEVPEARTSTAYPKHGN